MLVTESGIVMLLRPDEAKANSPMVVMLLALGNSTVDRLVHS